jgi:hypothetical protein
MFISTKLLPVLALAISLAPLAAQARSGDLRLIHQSNATQMTPACWATIFGFQPTNCKPAVCTDVQKGFWPRPSVCAR